MALWAGSVRESPCLCVIVDNGKHFLSFFNRVGMYGSEYSTSKRTSKWHDLFKSYTDFNNVFFVYDQLGLF